VTRGAHAARRSFQSFLETSTMRGPIGNLMQQAQKMQENLQRAQEELASVEVTGQSGGGMVQVTMTARMEVRRVRLDPKLLADDVEMAEDLIAAAFNDAVNKANEESQKRMSQATAGMPLPPGMKLPGMF
jgi:nucleoid-associated protein EbfC